MKKYFIIILVSLFLVQFAKAQNKDTLLYYMKNDGGFINKKAKADYFLFIMPPDSSSGTKLYPINEYYPDGRPKFIGLSSSKYFNSFTFEGPCLNFYSNGKRQSIINYSNGYKAGDAILYYPNGKLCANESYAADSKCYLIECRDSLGNVLAKNGIGKWVKYDDSVKSELEEGPIQDSLEEGQWKETYPGHEKYIIAYHKGKIVSSTDPARFAADPVFMGVEKMPEFEGGQSALNNSIAKSIKYPSSAKENNIQGTVYVEVIIEKDGSLSNYKIIRSPNECLNDEAIRVVKSLPAWIPGRQNGLHVRVEKIVPVKFVLNDN